MNNTVKERIGWWLARAKNLQDKGLHDEFVRFFIYYMCLDAWITDESGKEGDGDKIRWLISDEGMLKEVFIKKEFDLSDAVILRTLSPIYDMRSNHSNEIKELNDSTNFNQLVNFIYQIRCNLFHGGKDSRNERDSSLVFYAGEFLRKWITYTDSKSNPWFGEDSTTI